LKSLKTGQNAFTNCFWGECIIKNGPNVFKWGKNCYTMVY